MWTVNQGRKSGNSGVHPAQASSSHETLRNYSPNTAPSSVSRIGPGANPENEMKRRSDLSASDPRFMVPYVTETTPRGERTMDIYSRLLNDRIIFLGTPLDDQVANAVMAQMLHFASEDSDQDINLYINSPGGSVPGMLTIHDTINFVSCDVATTAMGFAASALAFLLMSGTKGKRHALPNTRIVLHQVLIQGGLGGQASDVEVQANELVYNKRRVNEIIAERTGQPFEKVERDTDRDYILSPEEAVEYGVIDQIICFPLERVPTSR